MDTPTPLPNLERLNWLDGVRVLACFLVIVCHCTDPYLYSRTGALFVTFVRPSVPLFVMISGALLLPMRGTTETFLRRRFARLVAPFLLWGILLALLPLPGPEPNWAPSNALTPLPTQGGLLRILYNVGMLPFNFTGSNIHFWFLYVIMGLYLFIPVISPWVRQTSNRGLAAFLGLWGFTLFLPYLQHWPGHALFPALHGECDWNARGMTFYFGGYLGYLLLGHLLARLPEGPRGRTLLVSALMLGTGWAATYVGYVWTTTHQTSPKDLEFFIENLSPNVALMATGLFLACRTLLSGGWGARILAPLSILSFGIFLIHYWVLQWVQWAAQRWFLKDPDALVAIPVVAGLTFLIGVGLAKAISRLPGSRWLLG